MIDCVKIARALSDPIRYRIMLMIARGNRGCCSLPRDGDRRGICNCELIAATGMIQSRVSYHMKELVEAGLVLEEPRGRWKFYSVNPEALKCFVGRLQEDFSLSD
ncbi:MAG: ArsR/SmtB family transcription factor [Ignavibacteriales bacterium]